MSAAPTLAELGISVGPPARLPPPSAPVARQAHVWARVAAQIAAHPVGSWVPVVGLEALAAPHGANALVVACRRAGFRVAVRQRPDALYVLRGRSVDAEG